MLEAWSGLLALSSMFVKHGGELVGAIEWTVELLELVGWLHPKAFKTDDFYKMEWKGWQQLIGNVDVITGGFACVTLSRAGKQLMEKDVRSAQLMDTVGMAVYFEARAVLLENVVELVDKDNIHGMLTEAKQFMTNEGFMLVSIWRQNHARCGGASQRQRVLPLWVRAEVAMVVAPVRMVDACRRPGTVRSSLRRVEDVPGWCVVKGEFVQTHLCGDADDVYKALKEGQLRYDPFKAPLTKGSLVWQYNDNRDWIVENIDCQQVRLLFDSRKKLQRRVVEWKFVVPMLVWSTLQPGMVAEQLETGVKWTLIGIDGRQVHMEQMCGMNKLWMKCDLKYIGLHGVRFENVFSIDRPSVTIRNMPVPFGNNGMLIHDTRMAQGCVRCLLGDELAAIMEVPTSVSEYLHQKGADWAKIGQWAGNSIPASLVEEPVSETVRMLKQYDSMQVQGQAHSLPVISVYAPALWMKVTKVVLVPIYSVTMQAWMPECDDSIWGRVVMSEDQEVRETSRQMCKRWVMAHLKSRQIHADVGEVEMAADFVDDDVRTRVMVWVSTVQPATTNLVGMRKLDRGAMRQVVAPAMVKAGVMLGIPMDATLVSTARGIGSVPIQMLELEDVVASPTQPTVAIQDAINRMEIAHEELRQCIALIPDDHDCKQTMIEWEETIGPVPMEELAGDLEQIARVYDNEVLGLLPYSTRVRAPLTKWPDRVSRGMPPKGFEPRSLHDILRPWAYSHRKDWFTDHGVDLKAMSGLSVEDMETYVRVCTWVCCIGESGFWPQAYGTVWDFTHRIHGVIQPMDLDSEVEPWLNVDYMFEQCEEWAEVYGKQYPDQELLHSLKYGVSYKADLPYQIVLTPHLVSLKYGFKPIFDEMVKLTGRGWYAMFEDFVDNPPCMPEKLTSRGSEPRANEPLRPRPVSDGGQPRKETQDSDGVVAVSINDGSKTLNLEGEEKWPKEVKPTHTDVMVGMCVLLYVAAHTGMSVYMFTDDASNFFNQMMLARSDYWQNQTFMYDWRSQTYVLVAEYCMAFGLSPASNIAQRLAILIVEIVKMQFDAEEDIWMKTVCTDQWLIEWWKRRKILSETTGNNEARLYVLEMYTDDPISAVLGSDRMTRFLLCWTKVTRKLRLTMAIALKRQLGCSVKWIGARYFSAGLITVPKDKRVKAMFDLKKLIAWDLYCSQLRSLNGLLEFIMVVVQLKRSKMAGMYEAWQAGGAAEGGPDSYPVVTKFMAQTANSWITMLSQTCAAPFSAALQQRDSSVLGYVGPMIPLRRVFYAMTSDASKEGAKVPGMGGYFCGLCWSFAFTEEMMQFDIPATELMAFGINLIMFGGVLQSLLKDDNNLVVAYIDAQASPQLLLKTGTTSPKMSRILNLVRGLKQYQMVKHRMAIQHTYGEGNLASDGDSRGKQEERAKYCLQVGIKSRTLQITQEVWNFVNACVYEALGDGW